MHLHSPVVAAVDGENGLLQRLNDLNATISFARFLALNGTVFAAVDIQAAPLVPAHLHRAILGLGNLADGVDELLQREFGGRTAFGEFRPRPTEQRLGFRPNDTRN